MGKTPKPVPGTICNGLIKEDYDYHLSGDCSDFCHCILTDKYCIGMTVQDPEDQSTDFFSRGRNIPDDNRLKKCPTYGCSPETFKIILNEKKESDLKKKLELLLSKK